MLTTINQHYSPQKSGIDTPCASHHYQYEHQYIRSASWSSARQHRPGQTTPKKTGNKQHTAVSVRGVNNTTRTYIEHTPKRPRTSALHYERYAHVMYRSPTRPIMQSSTQCVDCVDCACARYDGDGSFGLLGSSSDS